MMMSNTRFEVNENKDLMPVLMYISFSKYERDWASIIHSHSTAEIIYISGGKGRICIKNRQFTVGYGDFVLIPPHTMHTEESSSESPLEYYVLGIANINIPMNSPEEFNPVIELGSSNEEIKNLIMVMYKEIQMKREGYQMMMTSLLLQITVIMMRRKKLEIGFEESHKLRSDLAIVKNYIDAHYAAPITLNELAELSFMSKFHLVREFSKALGASPIEYLLERRIGAARQLLVSTGMSISDIASSVGFSSSSYFSQRFKMITGVTPMEFRNATIK